MIQPGPFGCRLCKLHHGHGHPRHDVRQVLEKDYEFEWNPHCNCGIREIYLKAEAGVIELSEEAWDQVSFHSPYKPVTEETEEEIEEYVQELVQ